jgi:hypothetical protein
VPPSWEDGLEGQILPGVLLSPAWLSIDNPSVSRDLSGIGVDSAQIARDVILVVTRLVAQGGSLLMSVAVGFAKPA